MLALGPHINYIDNDDSQAKTVIFANAFQMEILKTAY